MNPLLSSVRLKEFKQEFEAEASSPVKKRKEAHEEKKEETTDQSEQPIDLNMEVYEDKDYDIEEVRFWNFISRSKGAKPNLIRTYVYKVPESTYVVKRCKLAKPRTSTSPKNKQ